MTKSKILIILQVYQKMTKTKYGVISDVHSNPNVVPRAIEALKTHGAEKLLVNGDIGNRQKTIGDSQDYVAFILDSIGESELEAFVQPGSHETLLAYGPIIEHFTKRYSNLVDVTKQQKVEQAGHDLVFLPGSDFFCGGEYQIGMNGLPSGRFFTVEDGLVKFDDFGQYVNALEQGIAEEGFQYANIDDLRGLVTQPEKTVVVCHVPRKFDNLETAVDVAEFGEAVLDFKIGKNVIEKGSVLPLEFAKQIVEQEGPVLLKNENRGNSDLASVYDEIGVRKAVSGHFHESGHRANDRNGNHVEEGEEVDELFWNSGWLDNGQTGILTVEGEKVSYQNINL